MDAGVIALSPGVVTWFFEADQSSMDALVQPITQPPWMAPQPPVFYRGLFFAQHNAAQ